MCTPDYNKSKRYIFISEKRDVWRKKIYKVEIIIQYAAGMYLVREYYRPYEYKTLKYISYPDLMYLKGIITNNYN